jgi:hypothetical protein
MTCSPARSGGSASRATGLSARDSAGVQDGAAHWSGGRRCHMLWAVWLHQDVMMLRPR